MNHKYISLSLTALFAISMLGAASANSLPRTEVRDPVRGVSFNSIEVSQQPINSLQVIEGTFGNTDSLVVGMSALSFDESEGVDEYILWLRHEGRTWLRFDIDQPVSFEVDGQRLVLEQMRASQPFMGNSGRLFEKVEFRVNDAAYEQLVQGDEINITLRSDSGIVEKTLTKEEIDRIRLFRVSPCTGRIPDSCPDSA